MQQIDKKTENESIEKWAKNVNRYVAEGKVQLANKQMTR